jgi:hypothetical protein
VEIPDGATVMKVILKRYVVGYGKWNLIELYGKRDME